MTQRAIQYWVIPPEENAEFVAAMEEVLDVYAQPYDADNPVICIDEQPVQLVKETRPSLPMVMDEVNAGQLFTRPSANYYFMGYRLQDGIVVYTSAPIIVNVQ